jgi:phage shock protein PspC (stress-responsive transcriptional regulator)
MADQVVASLERSRDRRLPLQGLENLVGSPAGAAERWCVHTVLVNLAEVVLVFCIKDVVRLYRTLNHFLPDPSQLLKSPAHGYSQTMTGPWAWVHWLQIALTFPPAATGAERSADVPPLHMTLLSVTVMVGL